MNRLVPTDERRAPVVYVMTGARTLLRPRKDLLMRTDGPFTPGCDLSSRQRDEEIRTLLVELLRLVAADMADRLHTQNDPTTQRRRRTHTGTVDGAADTTSTANVISRKPDVFGGEEDSVRSRPLLAATRRRPFITYQLPACT